MTLILADHLKKSFGSFDILRSVSFSIPLETRIGLVGPNGCGKTTLLRILIGEQDADEGTVRRSKGLRIGYLPQKIVLSFDQSVYEICHEVFSDLIELQDKMKSLTSGLEKNPDDISLLEEFGRVQETFEQCEGYLYEQKIKRVLNGLGFSESEAKKPWKQLSGGQKTRAYLAKILLEDPDLLVLDEPTNHLDIEAIEWLEGFIKEFSGSVLIVSHDRYFLDQTVQTIWEMDPGFEIYHGNYSAYLVQREARYERMSKEFEAQQQFIAREEEYIRRNIEGQNTRQAQGRRIRLERMLQESRLTAPKNRQEIKLRLETVKRSGDIVLRTNDLKVGYHDDRKVLINVPDLTLLRGECAAIIGPNGAGKSTFIKTILAELSPLGGQVVLGANLDVGYFAQAHEKLDRNKTAFETIGDRFPAMLPQEIRSFLARYLFFGDDVYKKVSMLSGGERGRLALAMLSLLKANLLLLDEPMNHLDVEAQETLQAVLKEFTGTIILVSHDRYLVDAIASQIWEIEPATASLTAYNGTYSEYRAWKQTGQGAVEEKIRVPSAASTAPISVGKTETPKLSNNARMRLLKEKENLENKIKSFEQQLQEISLSLQNPAQRFEEIAALGRQYSQLEQELNQALEAWTQFEI